MWYVEVVIDKEGGVLFNRNLEPDGRIATTLGFFLG